ncbi:MAG TPA: nucleotide-binding protein [Longimicrobium sp.]|jgi:predicted nucleotide-binding protein|uniref:nucleotide-binding protein n=1 Tax=Longimicrobium sp. TaxID=2029185 RepID=UPI002EDB3C95
MREAFALHDRAVAWNAGNLEFLRRAFTTLHVLEDYRDAGAIPAKSVLGYLDALTLAAVTKEAIKKLSEQLVSIRDNLIFTPEVLDRSPAVVPVAARMHTNRAFIVHGHDDAAREGIARFLERLGVEPIILHEQVNEGRTIIEKLEHHSEVDFAVVLLTPDDVGATAAKRDALQPRARQNVVLEMGYFAGKLGRRHVCAVIRGDVELPSDMLGVVYVSMDAGGAWKLMLAKELKAAGFVVDMNRAM